MSSEEYEINCTDCGEKAYVSKIDHEPDKALFKVVLNCPNHKIKMDVPEDEIDKYMYPFFQSSLHCPHCAAKYPEFLELDSYLKFSARFSPVHLLLKKFCVNCQQKTVYEFTNRLYVKFYDLYYQYLRDFERDEFLLKYQEFFTCHECNSEIVAKNIGLQEGKAFVEGLCMGDGHHKTALAGMPLNHRSMWLGLLYDAINTCELCHSKDITIEELDFTLKKMFSSFGLRSRWIIRSCNNCQERKLLMMHHGHYEIYRRILKESEDLEAVGALYCSKCSSKVSLEKLDVKKDEMIVHLACEEKHKTKLNLDLKDKKDWIYGVLNAIDLCPKCWSTSQKGMMISHKLYGYDLKTSEFKIELKCPNCKKKRSIMLNNIVFDEVIDFFYK